MLETLFGNQNIVRILYFLFVNQSCYGMQLSRLLDIPLTPIQNALTRLEESKFLKSNFLGKNRIYQLNENHPLKEEMELLLKKAYSLLAPAEKKRYCFIHKPLVNAKEENKRDLSIEKKLEHFWEKLLTVNRLTINVKLFWLRQEDEKKGKGKVNLSKVNPNTLIFQERGLWECPHFPETSFTNTYRWTLDKKAGMISLEHLRYGINNSVFLFHLFPSGDSILESIDSHLCGEDVYFGKILWVNEGIHFSIRAIGPKKNEEVQYFYQS